MNSSTDFGAAAIPASLSTSGLNHSTFDRWMFTGTE